MLFTKKFKKKKMINYSASKKSYMGLWNFIDIICDFKHNQYYNKRNQNLNYDYMGIKCHFLDEKVFTRAQFDRQ